MKKIHIALAVSCMIASSVLQGMSKELETVLFKWETQVSDLKKQGPVTKTDIASIRTTIMELLKSKFPEWTEAKYVVATALIMLQLMSGQPS